MNRRKIGIAGLGALGGAIAKACLEGVEGLELVCAAEKHEVDFDVELVDFDELAARCDVIVEALPPAVVPDLAESVFTAGKDLVLLSSCALLLYPEILEAHKKSKSRIFVPSGALLGLDGVQAIRELGIERCEIRSTKPPKGFMCAPYVVAHGIDLEAISEKTCLFTGNAIEAAAGFPANVNVAATLSFAANGPERTQVEIWADPDARGNSHEITLEGGGSVMNARVENRPDPSNPKSSMLAAQSVVAFLRGLSAPLAVL